MGLNIRKNNVFFFNKRGITHKNSWYGCEMPYLFNFSIVIEFYFPNLKFFNVVISYNQMYDAINHNSLICKLW